MALLPSNPSSEADKRAQRDALQHDALLREVDEAYRQDQLARIYRNHGRTIIGAVIGGLALFGAYLGWSAWSESGREKTSEELVKAMDQLAAGNSDTAIKSLSKIEKEGDAGAVTVAKLSRAAVAMGAGKPLDAARIYGEIAADEDAPQPYRDLATIRQVSLTYDKMKPADIVKRLKPLAKPGAPFFGSAGELLGSAYLDMGKPDLAGPIFAAIAKDEKMPTSQRSRARQLAGLMGIDAIVDVDQTLKQLRQDGEEAAGAAQ